MSNLSILFWLGSLLIVDGLAWRCLPELIAKYFYKRISEIKQDIREVKHEQINK